MGFLSNAICLDVWYRDFFRPVSMMWSHFCKLENFLFFSPTSSQRRQYRQTTQILAGIAPFYWIFVQPRFCQGSRLFSFIGMRWLWKYTNKNKFQPCFKISHLQFRFFLLDLMTLRTFIHIHWHCLILISTFLAFNSSHFQLYFPIYFPSWKFLWVLISTTNISFVAS